ncbi:MULTISPECIES: FeoA family protein [Deefgea]|uniref:Ferrous iron transport protein A n=1 Tax=Deefgea chitinilytica TaxID=570276 RepID=A0ABS2CCN9_9NEIS|nr:MULTISPECIES: FeoA family protein [Deefgea]MBM5571807.1 ferrous iron transport protein A [Deefgea chitinilytica]MBM9889042.1 ferrous iron transport protein A [Deefgea sp. CFH1-16]
MLNLAQLALHQRAVVRLIATASDLVPRLSALGLREQCEITVLRRGWLGGPLQVRVGNTDFMLRRADAALIQVAILESAPAAPLEAAEALV